MERKVKLIINKDLTPFLKRGQIIEAIENDGVITDRFLRRRLQDAKIDHCISYLENEINETEKKGKR